MSRRQARSSYYLSSSDTLTDALALLGKTWDGRTAIRLLGLGFVNLECGDAGTQGELFSDGAERIRKAEGAVFEIERRGLGKVTRARLLGRENRGRPGSRDGKPDAG